MQQSSAQSSSLLGNGAFSEDMGNDPDSYQFPTGLWARAIATLDPGYFAWVMASGIVSIGAQLLGYPTLSTVVLYVTEAAFALLCIAYIARLVLYPSWVRRSLRDPAVAMAYFTVVAGTDVLATRLLMAGHPLVTLILGAGAALVWIALTYGLPSFIVASAKSPVLRELNGTWFIWVVGTQSLAIVAAGLAPTTVVRGAADAFIEAAVCLWGVGVILYILIVVVIFIRLMLVEVTPAEMGPAYWIAMGATAISTRAAAGILVLHGRYVFQVVDDLRPFLAGMTFILWAFGSWWIPLLVLFGIWRYVVRDYSRSYEPRLWSMVFPLGMYTVACYSFGKATNMDFLVDISRVWIWVGVLAWVAVLVMMVAAGLLALSKAHRPSQDSQAVVSR
ncbi:MAG: tellurite resistance/C4-dicarboxylate transporter family protein [Actinobacteria bacterium]|nr:tellurite resistance/C4-dicarboxylate transporter family protein [Actinomycetota bacterium]